MPDTTQSVGARIRAARERNQLSQGELAKRLGMEQRAISEMENGKRRVPVSELAEISLVLQTPILFFFEDVLSSSDLDAALLQEFRRISNRSSQLAIIEVVRSIADILNQPSS